MVTDTRRGWTVDSQHQLAMAGAGGACALFEFSLYSGLVDRDREIEGGGMDGIVLRLYDGYWTHSVLPQNAGRVLIIVRLDFSIDAMYSASVLYTIYTYLIIMSQRPTVP